MDEPWCQFVIRGLNKPIASSSANLSGEPTPAEFSTINQQIIDAVDYVSTHRRNEKITSAPSFMVEFDEKVDLRFSENEYKKALDHKVFKAISKVSTDSGERAFVIGGYVRFNPQPPFKGHRHRY